MWMFNKKWKMVFFLSALGSMAWQGQAQENQQEPWRNESEAGVVIVGGNAKSETYNLRQLTSFQWSRSLLRAQGHYLRTEAYNRETARFWDAALRYEHELGAPLSIFVQQQVESNKYAGFDYRHNSDAGLKYFFIKDEDTLLVTEVGYRYTIEDRIVKPDRKQHKGRAFAEYDQGWTDSLSSHLWVEYLPNFTRSKDWQINGEAALSVAINNVFSVKGAYLVKYDDEPFANLKKEDTFFTASLLAKF
jgi:putative salt-induced outer membrane protein